MYHPQKLRKSLHRGAILCRRNPIGYPSRRNVSSSKLWLWRLGDLPGWPTSCAISERSILEVKAISSASTTLPPRSLAAQKLPSTPVKTPSRGLRHIGCERG